MLDIFAINNIQATFFIGGRWAKLYPAVLADIAGKGHEIGNHTYSHSHPNSLSKEKNLWQIIKAKTLIRELTGVKINLYAPPYGE